MARATVPEGEFIELIRQYGIAGTAKRVKTDIRNVYRRRKSIETMRGVSIASPDNRTVRPKEYPWQVDVQIQNGIAIVGSDGHYWPGPASLMHRAMVWACKEFRPKAVFYNGDSQDFPSISRHSPIGWEHRPTVADEIEACKERMHEIEKATFKARKIWTFGNHDQRFESRLASQAPEYAKLHGMHLKDHYPAWECGWTSMINNDCMITHRWKAGQYAPMNNAMRLGKSCVTGHLHAAQVMHYTDLNGTRYGVDAGCIADTDHRAFSDYTEGKAHVSWRSAFCVLTFKDGRLMAPELVTKWDDDRIQFRGEIFSP